MGDDTQKDIERLNKWFTNQIKPKNLHGSGSFEAKYDKDFEDICFLMTKYTNKDPKFLTVKEFYTVISHIKSKKK